MLFIAWPRHPQVEAPKLQTPRVQHLGPEGFPGDTGTIWYHTATPCFFKKIPCCRDLTPDPLAHWSHLELSLAPGQEVIHFSDHPREPIGSIDFTWCFQGHFCSLPSKTSKTWRSWCDFSPLVVQPTFKLLMTPTLREPVSGPEFISKPCPKPSRETQLRNQAEQRVVSICGIGPVDSNPGAGAVQDAKQQLPRKVLGSKSMMVPSGKLT